MDQYVFLPHFPPFFFSLNPMMKNTFVFRIQHDCGCGGRPACAHSGFFFLFFFFSRVMRMYTHIVSVFFILFILFLFYYRVAPCGVIDSRPRSIDCDYQGRVGVMRDLLSGSDRVPASDSPYGIKIKKRGDFKQQLELEPSIHTFAIR